MTDVFDRIKAANPVPDPDRYCESVTGDGRQLLGSIRDRRDHMTADEITRLETPQAPPSRSGPRGWKVAVTAAAAVVALVIAGVLLSSDEEPVSQYADAAAGGEPAAIFGLFVDSYRTGDMEGALPYVDADISSPFLGDAITWMPGLIEFQGALYGRNEPGPSVCEGPDESGWVSCTFTEAADGILAAAGFPETTWRGKLADGRIVTFVLPGRAEGDVILSHTADAVERPLGEYAAEVDPEGMAAQCDIARSLETGELVTFQPVVYNQQCGAFIAGFLDDYLATLGG